MLLCFVIVAVFWVTRINLGLQLYPARIVLPILQTAFTLLSVTAGFVYFQEWVAMTTLGWIIMPCGLALVIAGVLLLTMLSQPGADDRTVSPTSPHHVPVPDPDIGHEYHHHEYHDETASSRGHHPRLSHLSTVSSFPFPSPSPRTSTSSWSSTVGSPTSPPTVRPALGRAPRRREASIEVMNYPVQLLLCDADPVVVVPPAPAAPSPSSARGEEAGTGPGSASASASASPPLRRPTRTAIVRDGVRNASYRVLLEVANFIGLDLRPRRLRASSISAGASVLTAAEPVPKRQATEMMHARGQDDHETAAVASSDALGPGVLRTSKIVTRDRSTSLLVSLLTSTAQLGESRPDRIPPPESYSYADSYYGRYSRRDGVEDDEQRSRDPRGWWRRGRPGPGAVSRSGSGATPTRGLFEVRARHFGVPGPQRSTRLRRLSEEGVGERTESSDRDDRGSRATTSRPGTVPDRQLGTALVGGGGGGDGGFDEQGGNDDLLMSPNDGLVHLVMSPSPGHRRTSTFDASMLVPNRGAAQEEGWGTRPVPTGLEGTPLKVNGRHRRVRSVSFSEMGPRELDLLQEDLEAAHSSHLTGAQREVGRDPDPPV